MLFPGSLLGPRVLHPSGKELRHHSLPCDPGATLSTHSSSGTDQVTAWVKTDPGATLVRQMVDVQKATADFREASERRHETSAQTNRFNKKLPNRSPVQKRLSICNWNPGPRRGKEDAFDKQIAGRWHVITLQEASEHVDHDILTCRFHVTHYGGRAILFNKDAFYPNIDVKSIYLNDTRRDLPDQVIEGEQGWVMQGVLSRASFRRPPLSGQKTFTVLSLHFSNIYAKKTGSLPKKLIFTIRAITIGQQIDVVACDFNGTAWRCSNRDNISTIDEAFAELCIANAAVALHHCGDEDRFQTTGLTSVGSLKPLGSDRYCKVRMYGAFSIPRKSLGPRPTDQSCHHETWLHLDFVDWRNSLIHITIRT